MKAPAPFSQHSAFSARGAKGWCVAFCVVTPILSFAAIKKSEGPIPELRPPKAPITLSLPEATVFNSALGLALAILLVGRFFYLRRPLPPAPVEPPLHVAKRALAAVNHSASLIEDCSLIVRRYLAQGYQLITEGATTHQLTEAFAAHSLSDPEISATVRDFFGDCDLARFAPHTAAPLAEGLIERTDLLLERLEARRNVAQISEAPSAT